MAAFGRDMAWNANTAALAYLRAALRDGHALEVLEFPSGPGYPGVADYADTRVGAVSGLYVEKAGGDAILLINTGVQAVNLAHPFARASGRSLGGSADGRVPGPSDGTLPGAGFEVPGKGPVELPPFSVMLIEER